MRTAFVLVPFSFEATVRAVCNKTVSLFFKVAVVVARVLDVSVALDEMGSRCSCFGLTLVFQVGHIWTDDALVNCSFGIS